ncbi:MAG: electron transfer flavoprotein subunit beta/FixA family protein [Thermoprotei archaeon]
MVDVAVMVKASLDANMIRVDSSGKLLIEEIPLVISEYDRNAVEEAVRIKEKFGGKIAVFSVVTWGPLAKRINDTESVLREALAMGADEAYMVTDERLINANPLQTAIALASAVKKTGNYDLYLTGEASMDVISAQIASRIGTILNLPTVTFARAIELDIENKKVKVLRDLEDSLQWIEASLPAVISVTGEINRARLPMLLQIRRAFAKPLKKFTLNDLNIQLLDVGHRRESVRLLMVSRKNIIIEASTFDEVSEKLISKLIEEGVIKPRI